jgi:hypothetical protein
MAVKPVPDGCAGATPYLAVSGAACAIEFYERAFGATELMRMADPSGEVQHAGVRRRRRRCVAGGRREHPPAVGPQDPHHSPRPARCPNWLPGFVVISGSAYRRIVPGRAD